MIKITFNEEFRVFPKGYTVTFDTDKVILVGDNGCGKSTLLLIILSKIFIDNNLISLFIENTLGTFIHAIYDEEIVVEMDKKPLPVIMDTKDFNNDSLVQREVGGAQQIAKKILSSHMSSGEKKLEEVLDNVYIQKNGYADRTSVDGNLLILDEPDANLSLSSLIKLKRELEDVEQCFIIYHNPYLIAKEKKVYYLRLGHKGMACKIRKISGESYIVRQEKIT